MSAQEGEGYETRSECSRSSKTSEASESSKLSKLSHRSAAHLAAIEASAKADAACARASYALKEIEVKVNMAELKVEETWLDATLEAMKQEKEAQAALAEATVFEAAMDSEMVEELSGAGDVNKGSVHKSAETTEKYVKEQNNYVNAFQPPDNPQVDTGFELAPTTSVDRKPSSDCPPMHQTCSKAT